MSNLVIMEVFNCLINFVKLLTQTSDLVCVTGSGKTGHFVQNSTRDIAKNRPTT